MMVKDGEDYRGLQTTHLEISELPIQDGHTVMKLL